MLCDKYMRLSPQERSLFIGNLLHAAQSDDNIFQSAEELINLAERKGLFDGVTIMPEREIINNEPSSHIAG